MNTDIIKPNTLSECFEQLNKIIAEAEDADWFRTAIEAEAIAQSHHGLGGWIRNNWGFWKKEGKLYEFLSQLGLHHPDDMSGVILTSYHRHLNKKEIDLDGQIKDYIEFWKGRKND